MVDGVKIMDSIVDYFISKNSKIYSKIETVGILTATLIFNIPLLEAFLLYGLTVAVDYIAWLKLGKGDKLEEKAEKVIQQSDF